MSGEKDKYIIRYKTLPFESGINQVVPYIKVFLI